jgi:hypothetical protein
MTKKICLCTLICLVAGFSAMAEESSLLEKRKDIIRYGIESEILDLIKALQAEKEDKLNDGLLTVLAESNSPKLQEALFNFFSAREWNGAIADAVKVVDGRDEAATSSVLAALSYLAALHAKEGIPEAQEIVKADETKYLSPAIRILGRAGEEEEAQVLLGIFDTEEASDAVKQETILALGELKSAVAVDKLMKILDDESSGKATRMYSANSLGKIGDVRAIPSLIKAANGDDPQVRSYAITALGSFTDAAAETAVVQALRDSTPAVRSAAIKSAATANIHEAEPYIRYRAKNDPDKKVRLDALKALGTFGGSENIGFLQGMIQDKKLDTDSRSSAFAVLLDKDSDGSRSTLEKVLAAESAEKDPALFKVLLRALSMTEAKSAAPLVETYLLRSTDYTARIAGIEWVRRNKAGSLRPIVAALAETDKVEAVKKRAVSALEDL